MDGLDIFWMGIIIALRVYWALVYARGDFAIWAEKSFGMETGDQEMGSKDTDYALQCVQKTRWGVGSALNILYFGHHVGESWWDQF